MTRPTAVVSHPDCARHDTGWKHPEHQGRLPAIVRGLYRQTPALLDRMLQVEASSGTPALLHTVHSERHVAHVRAAAEAAEAAGQPRRLTPDTMISGASWEAALGAVGAAREATRLVLAGEARTAFALTRPPGHHATADAAMGFCLFNNAAVAARWAQAEGGAARVLIVDWDAHHGNGTQELFYRDGSVYYLSFHLSGHYPGTGGEGERGAGAGAGATRNVPFGHGTGREAYLEAFERVVGEVAGAFRPELIVVSAGFDCLAGDPLGGLALEPADLHVLARVVMEAGSETAGGRVVALLEGGYVPARIAAAAVEMIRAFAGLPALDAD